MVLKICPKCTRELPATTDYFHSHRRMSEGLYNVCKDCANAIRRQGDSPRLFIRNSYLLSEKTCTKCGATYPLTSEFWQRDKRGLAGFMPICKSCRCAVKKAWADANPDKIKEMKRQSHIRCREKNLKRSRDWQDAHWGIAYPRIKAHGRKRRALALGSGGEHTAAQIWELFVKQQGLCFYCGDDITAEYHVDHYIPLTRGGSNDISNIVLACPHCNLSKNNRLPSEWQPKP